jgi:hypothetical protein
VGSAGQRRGTPIGVLALVLLACLALAAPSPAAKKKGKGAGKVDVTKAVNAPVPDAAAGVGGLDGVLRSTIQVGKQFKGKQVRDVNVTVQTLGTSGLNSAEDLTVKLTGPNGATVNLFGGLEGFNPTNPSIGPLTLDDEAFLSLGFETPTNPNLLYQPWTGAAEPLFGMLISLDGGPVRGTWTLTVLDQVNGGTSNLASWRLNVIGGRPFLTEGTVR